MMKKLLRLATLALLFTGVASAQSTGSITGVVTDGATGKPVVGALVVATSPAVPGQQTAVTDAKGTFTVTGLPAGQYKLQASLDGYKPETRADLALGENVTLRANLAIVPEAVQLEEVVVTGSRIKRKDLTTAAPVSVINKEQMVTSGKISLGDFLQSIPEQGNTVNAQVNNGNDGSVLVSLRSLGASRTLVLVNGRRAVGDGGVDLGSIPVAAVERIEVLKDGASAVYGSDAVAGVVNIILKKRMNGTEVSAFTSSSSRGDAQTHDFSAMTGTGSDKGNILFSLGYQQSGSLLARDRNFSQETGSYNFGTGQITYSGNSGTFPSGRFTLPAAACAGTPTGLIANACAARDVNLNAPNYGPGDIRPTWDPTANGGLGATTGYVGENYSLYNTYPTNYILTPATRVQLFSTGDANLGSWGRAYYEASYVDRSGSRTLAPMPLTNNSIPSNVISVSKDSVYNPFGVDITSWRKRMTEFGDRYWKDNAETFRAVVGVGGSLPDWAGPLHGWAWDVNFNSGKILYTQRGSGELMMSRVANAVGPSRWVNPADHSKGAQCVQFGPNYDPTQGMYANPNTGYVPDLKVIGGCVPMNVLGGAGAIDPTSKAYVSYDSLARTSNTIMVESASITGDLFKLMSDRPVAVAVGVEHREESLFNNLDATTTHSDSSGNNQSETRGGFKVTEAYAELNIPIIAKAPFIEELELQLAARTFKYNLFGSDSTYKVGGRYAPVRDATFRSTYSTAFRAPNVGELFGGTVDSYPSVKDPCNGLLSAKSATTAAQCAAQGVLPTGSADSSTQLLEKWLGNPDLKPEKAKTFTFGVVVEPRWVSNLSVALDYYDVTVDKAISRYGASAVLAGCYTAGDPYFCNLIHRDGQGRVTWLDDPKGNLEKFDTSGVDVSIRYGLPTANVGRFNFALDGNYLASYKYTASSGRVYQGKGYYDLGVLPIFKANLGVNWRLGNLGAGASIRYIGSIKECGSGACSVDATDARTIPAYAPLNLNAGYDLKSSAGTTSLLVGIQNVFDQMPPFVANASDFNSDPYTYDYVGRYYYVRLTQSF
jgi:outer membrane receptor protein involved in Fe transport